MSANNYYGFTHGGTQYGPAGSTGAGGGGGGYPGQAGYAVAPTAGAASSYGTQRSGYEQAYQTAGGQQGQYASSTGGGGGSGASVSYDYGYGRAPAPTQTYDASKTFYQQASTTTYAAAAQKYEPTAKVVGGYQTAQYVAGPTRNPAAVQNHQQQQQQSHQQQEVASQAAPNYTNYDAALYSAATMFVAQQSNKPNSGHGGNNWHSSGGGNGGGGGGNNHYKKQGGGGQSHHHSSGGGVGHGGGGGVGAGVSGANNKTRMKPQPKPQQLHYCEVCKISCAGPQTYREHLEGQKHKKREASLKLTATATTATQNRGNNLHCELCDVTCTGSDAYAAHVRGSKHQKVVKLHQKLGKPIPSTEPHVNKKVQVPKIAFVQQTGTELSMPGTAAPAAAAKDTSAGSTAQTTAALAAAASAAAVAAAAAAAAAQAAADAQAADDADQAMTMGDEIKPVGLDYIEELKGDDGKTLSFNCKLCECKFNDPNAKEMHMKGRRHRLQYKKKVQPDLVVDIKPNPRQRRMAEAKAQRAVMQAEYWNQRQRGMAGRDGCMLGGGGPGGIGGGVGPGGIGGGEDGEDDPMYWGGEERRRFEDEFDYMGGGWQQRGGNGGGGVAFGPARGGPPHMRPPPFFGMVPGRRPESSDDRHVVARHAEIYPKEEELQTIQRIVSHTERALKFVSDALTDNKGTPVVAAAAATQSAVVVKLEPVDSLAANGNGEASTAGAAEKAATDAAVAANKAKEDGRDNQMFSFQKDAEGGVVRLLKGVMRVGLLAKGLLLQGDCLVQLVVLCAEKPTQLLLKRVAAELPVQLKKVSEDNKYSISMAPLDSAVLVSDGTITVKVSLTSPLLRDSPHQAANNNAAAADQAAAAAQGTDDLLPREPCLQALAALRHAKWFQARATGLQSCVMVMRILRDLCARTPTWTPLSQWSMELLAEKIISSAGMPLSPGDCMRRVMEGISTGLLINGPGVLDPCEKEPHDALTGIGKQEREDLTVSAQTFLRLIAFRQIHSVLGMEPLPAPKFQQRQWRFGRKRRRSGGEAGGAGEDSGTAPAQKKDCSIGDIGGGIGVASNGGV